MKQKHYVAMCLLVFLIVVSTLAFLISNADDTVSSSSSITTDDENTSCNDSSDAVDEIVEESEASDATLSLASEQYVIVKSDSVSTLKNELSYCEEKLYLSQSIIELTATTGYADYFSHFVELLHQDCKNYKDYIDYYKEAIAHLDEIKYTQGLQDYPAATYIWHYMKDQGWSDLVCAGIMGNIMQETGGRTLTIDYLHNEAYYGMCCWNKEYHPDVVGLGLEGQCAYLIKTTKEIMETYGYLYQKGYTFQDFLEAESIEEAANAFMVVYERPGGSSSKKRIENGERAYAYFVGD